MSLAFCCTLCDDRKPDWRIQRHGDAIVSWSCARHLPLVLYDLQRYDERTEFTLIPRTVKE